MKKLLGVLLGCLLSAGSSVAYASPVTLHVDMNISTAWDYVKSQYVPIPQLTGSFTFTFDDIGVCGGLSSCPNGATFPDGLSATSTLSALIPSNYGDGFGSPDVYFAPGCRITRDRAMHPALIHHRKQQSALRERHDPIIPIRQHVLCIELEPWRVILRFASHEVPHCPDGREYRATFLPRPTFTISFVTG